MKLESEHKAFIIVRLACQQNIPSIVRELRETFGIEVKPAAIYSYDIGTPCRSKQKRVSKELEDLFHQTREKYNAGLIEVSIASRINRLQVLERNIKLAEQEGERSAIAAMVREARAESPDAKGGSAGGTLLRITVVDAASGEERPLKLPLAVEED